MKAIYNILFYIALIGACTYAMLYTFVLEQDGTNVEVEKREKVVVDDAIIKDDYYKDDNIEIKLTEDYQYKTHIYVADVVMNRPEYLRTAFAKDKFGRNITEEVSDMAKRNNAILAINGDYYGAREAGYVVRNYKQYRNTSSGNREDLVIYESGKFDIIKENQTKLEDLNNPKEVFTFGPGLLKDGEINVTENQEVSTGHRVSNPRTAICYIGMNHYAFVVSDGRTKASEGLSLYELASYMKGLGCQTAYNMDGGGSSVMVFNGKIINNPTHDGYVIDERKVSDMVYVGY